MISWFTKSIKEKLILLAIGATVTFFTTISSLFWGQYMLKADYNRDEMTRLELLTTFKLNFVHIEQKLDNMNKKIDRIENKVEKIKDEVK